MCRSADSMRSYQIGVAWKWVSTRTISPALERGGGRGRRPAQVDRRRGRPGDLLALRPVAGQAELVVDRGVRVVVVDLDRVAAGVGADQVAGDVRPQPRLGATGDVGPVGLRPEDLEPGVLQHRRVVREHLQPDRVDGLVARVGDRVGRDLAAGPELPLDRHGRAGTRREQMRSQQRRACADHAANDSRRVKPVALGAEGVLDRVVSAPASCCPLASRNLRRLALRRKACERASASILVRPEPGRQPRRPTRPSARPPVPWPRPSRGRR